jgi:flavin-dependent thymidylate synthase
MKVTLIDFTGNGCPNPARHAANILLFTKSTRLNMNPDLMLKIAEMPEDEVLFNLRVMSDTNPGSWEFVHFTFLIEKVSRAFCQQLTRTRQASYAQQSFRVVEIQDFTYETGPSITADRMVVGAYRNTMENSFQCYKFLVEAGVNVEDARGVLPLNTHTNICLSINMRNFIGVARKRTSGRVQAEYRGVMDACIMEIESVYPWFYIFYKSDQMKAYKDLLDLLYDNEKLTPEEKVAMYRKIDIMKSGID